MWKDLSFRLNSVSGLLMHNGHLADPLNPHSKEIKKVAGKKKKTEADHEQLALLEFRGSLYMGEDGPVIPAEVIEGCITGGARKFARGKDVKSSLVCTDHARLEYEGPRDADGLWKAGFFRRDIAKVGVNRVARTRPFFSKWSAVVNIEYDDEVLNGEDVREFITRAGLIVGVGDWRPKFGRFTVSVANQSSD